MTRLPFALACLLACFLAAPSSADPCLGSILMWGTAGSGPGQFARPYGISIPGDGLVYVTDQHNERVQVFNEFGTFVREWAIPPGGDGFAHPTGICVSNGVAWVSAHQGQHVTRWTTAGVFIGYASAPPGGWTYPTDIAATPAGEILVCDSGRNRVVRLSSNGFYLSNFATEPTPYGIAIKSSLPSAVYVCDTGDRVQRFDISGNYQCEFGSFGTGPNQLDVPSDIAFGSDGELFVVEYGNNRIQRFSLGPTPAEKTSWGRIKTIYR